jgi:hypothetical protein
MKRGICECDYYSYQRSRPFCILQINRHGLNRAASGVSSIPAGMEKAYDVQTACNTSVLDTAVRMDASKVKQ